MALHTHINQSTTDGHRILNFVLPWLDFGGGPSDEIFVQFGVTDRVFFERLADIASDERFVVSEKLRQRLNNLSKNRIAQIESTPAMRN